MKRIHVIIPIYNGERFLTDAVNSVLCKKGIATIVLVNDGSTDASGELCDKLAKEYSQINVIHQKNGGVSRARNAGIEYILKQGITEEDYFAFLDADDLWTEEASFDVLETVDADIYAFSSLITDEKAMYTKYLNKQIDEVRHLPGANADWFPFGHLCACLYKAEMVYIYNLRFMPGVKVSEDMIFCNQAGFCAKTIAFWGTPLLLYRMNPSSIMHSKKRIDDPLRSPRAWYTAMEWTNSLEVFTAQEKQKWKNKCSAIVGPAMLEATQLLVEQGFSYKQMQQVVFEDPLAVYLSELDISRLAESERPKLALLRKDKKLFFLKYYIRGLTKRFLRGFMRFRPIRALREKIRFRS